MDDAQRICQENFLIKKYILSSSHKLIKIDNFLNIIIQNFAVSYSFMFRKVTKNVEEIIIAKNEVILKAIIAIIATTDDIN